MRRWFHFSTRVTNSTRQRAARTRGIPVGAVFLILVASTSIGCDSFSFVPPPPEGLREAAGSGPVTVTDSFRPAATSEPGAVSSKSIELVLGPHDADESEVWKGAMRSQAGQDKARLRIFGPPEASASLADLVREALKHHPRVLLIESGSAVDPALLRAIEDAHGQGIPVVLAGRMPTGEKSASKTVGEPTTKSATPDPFDLDRPASAQKAPIVVVQPQAFDVSAGQLVAIALRGCHDSEVEPGKSALLLVNPTGDSFISDRAVAIKDALKAKGITAIDELRFSTNNKQSVKDVEARLKANAQTILVFAVDSVTSGVVKEVIRNDIDHRFLVAGCYAGDEVSADLSKVIKIAAVAVYTPVRLLRKAVATAASLAQGQDVPARIEFPVNVAESLATPAMLKAQAVLWKQAKEAPQQVKK